MQVGIANKYFGPIVLSLNYMMKDVLLFLITFIIIMVAFASGVSYIFNMASGEHEMSNVYQDEEKMGLHHRHAASLCIINSWLHCFQFSSAILHVDYGGSMPVQRLWKKRNGEEEGFMLSFASKSFSSLQTSDKWMAAFIQQPKSLSCPVFFSFLK